MIDIRLARADPDALRTGLSRRGIDASVVDRLIDLDRRVREIQAARDDARSGVKRLSSAFAEARRAGDIGGAEAAAEESRVLAKRAEELDASVEEVGGELSGLLLELPNLPSPECPDGKDADDNVVLRYWVPGQGDRERFDPAERFGPDQRVPHWEVGAELGILDLAAGAKLAGAMFPLFRRQGSALIRALSAFALDRHSDRFEEIRPPTFVRTETMVSTGHLPKFADDAYHIERDDLWAIPTAEVPLTSIARDEILPESALPLRMCASTPCFRREAGSAGRDTRGLLRVHEFDKVEILAYTTPEQAAEVHAELLARAEGLLRELGLVYRVVDLCAGDLGQSSARTFDLEAYAPGCDRWLEVSSVSWFSDYQARRANVRFRPAQGGAARFVHTLNGSALAWPRIWAALIESGRQADGSVRLPDCLGPYLGGRLEIGKPTAPR
jgi:seryl-tRNA synthetase